MKKTNKIVIISVTAVIAAAATVGVIAMTAQNNKSGPPTVWDKTASDYVDSYVPTEKDTIRSSITKERSEKKDKIYQQLLADGKDTKDAAFEADEQILVEQFKEVADVLKKHNKLDSDFAFKSVDDNVTGMKAACELLNHSENISAKDTVILEMYLEENYYVLRDVEGLQELMKEIEKTVNLPF